MNFILDFYWLKPFKVGLDQHFGKKVEDFARFFITSLKLRGKKRFLRLKIWLAFHKSDFARFS